MSAYVNRWIDTLDRQLCSRFSLSLKRTPAAIEYVWLAVASIIET